MKEIPVLFSTAMVQAILEGRKSLTRRLIKHKLQPVRDEVISGRRLVKPSGWPLMNVDEYTECFCPYGRPNDVYWVRETHYSYGWWIQEGTTKTGQPGWTFKDFTPEDQGGRYHFVTNPPAEVIEKRTAQKMGWYKRPAIFMPYNASRIWLQKESTKVEKACDISREDAIAEGLACITKDNGRTYKFGIPDLDGYPGIDNIGWAWQDWNTDPVEAFKSLWWKINGAETWNDWVWVNSFKVLSTTGKPVENSPITNI